MSQVHPEACKRGHSRNSGSGGGALPEPPVTVNQRKFVVADPRHVTCTAPTAKLGTVTDMLVELQFVTTAVDPPNCTVPPPCVEPKSAPAITIV